MGKSTFFKKKQVYGLLIIVIFFAGIWFSRHYFRPTACANQTPTSPHRTSKKSSLHTIETRWLGTSSPTFALRHSCLQEYPIFGTFNKKYFQNNIIPNRSISYRYTPENQVEGSELKNLIEGLIEEIRQKKKKFSEFKVLRESDFNRKNDSGLIILKCKKYPFVVKVFMETPCTFVRYKSKGIIPKLFFYMSGGVNRHLLGFTRIKNLENIRKKIAASSIWSNKVTFPRKWFYLPSKTKWIEITGYNIEKKNNQRIVIPGTYCIVADWIDATRITSVFSKKDRKQTIELCSYLDLAIDPHIDNFMIERSSGKFAIVDTEHFLTVAGMKKKKKFSSHFSWLADLAVSCIKAILFCGPKKQTEEASETELLY